eukprot:8127773-Pyramimonas_sp.AAC.1
MFQSERGWWVWHGARLGPPPESVAEKPWTKNLVPSPKLCKRLSTPSEARLDVCVGQLLIRREEEVGGPAERAPRKEPVRPTLVLRLHGIEPAPD